MRSELFTVLSLTLTKKNRSVKPGGWVEFQDWDGYPHSEDGSVNGTAFLQYYNEVLGAFEEAGYEPRPGPKLGQWFKDAGFVNIHVEKFVIPYGVWPKDKHLVSVHLVPTSNKNNRPLTSWYRKNSAPGTKRRAKQLVLRLGPWLF